MSEELRKQTTEFRMQYNKYFRTNVAPQLTKLEQERKSILDTLLIAFIVCMLVIATILVLKWDSFWILPALGIFLVPFISYAKSFKLKTKQKVMNLLLKAFGDDFIWSPTAIVTKDIILGSKLFEKYDKIDNDDNFQGTYKNLEFEISEFHMFKKKEIYISNSKGQRRKQKVYETIFDGLLININMNKRFSTHTIVMESGQVSLLEKLIGNFHQGLEKVVLEDPQFNKDFAVYSTDQVESRYLLTPSFMDRFKNVKTIFNSSNVSCSFKDNKILLAIDVRRDLFELGNLFTPATSTKQYEELFNELVAVLSFVDVLKLDLNVGL